nr:unnamed protein product [Spirometra erinaceieuropaei]
MVDSGVPQGSVLGPILFLIYIDDAASDLDCEVAMFAEDMKIWSVIRGPVDEDRLQMNLNRLEEWSNRWLLRFNVAKCSILRLGNTARSASTRGYFLGDAALQEVEAQRDLGVLTTSSLKPSAHCSRVTKSAMSVLYAIKRLSNAVCKEDPLKEQNEKNSWADFMDELFGPPDESTSLPFGKMPQEQEFQFQPPLTDSNYDREGVHMVPESFPEMLSCNGLLPRYIADSLKQGHATPPLPNDSNFDSGVSTSSLVSYHENLSIRARQRVTETQACLSPAPARPTAKSASKSVIEQLLDIHQPDHLNPHP